MIIFRIIIYFQFRPRKYTSNVLNILYCIVIWSCNLLFENTKIAYDQTHDFIQLGQECNKVMKTTGQLWASTYGKLHHLHVTRKFNLISHVQRIIWLNFHWCIIENVDLRKTFGSYMVVILLRNNHNWFFLDLLFVFNLKNHRGCLIML